jgi:hypothetical protein
MDEQLQSLQKAEVKIDGDSATLTVTSASQPMMLRKMGDKWKIDLQSMPGAQKMDLAIPLLNAMAKAADELADEINADRYKTADEARTAMQQKIAAVQANPPPTSQPNAPTAP